MAFTPSATDQSIVVLSQIFGPMTGLDAAAPTAVVIQNMIGVVTSFVTLFAILVLIYVVIAGTLMTAIEGEFIKKWSGTWLPFRMVLGLFLLIPMGNGYTVVQNISMQFITMGVGAADDLWTSAARNIRNLGAGGNITPPSAEIDYKLGLLFKGLVCEQTQRAKYISGDPNISDPQKRAACAAVGSSRSSDSSGCNYDIATNLCPAPDRPEATTREGCADTINNGYLCQDSVSTKKYADSQFCTISKNKAFFYPSFSFNPDNQSGSSTNSASYFITNPKYTMGIAGECGSFQHCTPNDIDMTMPQTNPPTTICTNPNSAQCVACLNQLTAFTGVSFQNRGLNADWGALLTPVGGGNQINGWYPILDPDHGLPALAQAFADVDYEYQKYYNYTIANKKDYDEYLMKKAACDNPPPAGYPGTFNPTGGSLDPTPPPAGCPAVPPPSLLPPAWIGFYCEKMGFSNDNCNSSNLPNPTKNSSGPPTKVVTDVYYPEMYRRVYAPNTANAYTLVQYSPGNQFDAMVQFRSVYTAPVTSLMMHLLNAATGIDSTDVKYTSDGWLSAGWWYLDLSQQTGKAIQNVWPTFNIDNADPDARSPVPDIKFYKHNYKAAGAVQSQTADSTSVSSQAVGGLMGDLQQAIFGNFKGQNVPNPLLALQRVGHIMLIAVQVSYAAYFALTLALGFVSGVNFWALGSGFFNPMSVAMMLTYTVSAPVVFLALGVCLTIGATLAVYIPLIPFMIFMTGFIGWVCSVIEVIIAGPIIAFGILLPGQSVHELMGRSENALLMILNVIFKPILMVIGLIFGLRIAGYVLRPINIGYWGPLYSFLGGDDPLSTILFMGVYIAIITIIMNKCFSLIHILPDRVFTYIGGLAGQSDAEMSSAAQGAAGKTAAGAGGAMRSAGETGTGASVRAGQIYRGKRHSGGQANVSGGDKKE